MINQIINLNKNKTIILFFILLFIILIMISFSFPDLFAMYYVPNHLFDGNIYTWVNNYKQICNWVSATWPPLYYYTFGLYIILIQKLGLLNPKLFTSSSCPVYTLILNQVFLFWAKLPFLMLHIASSWLFAQQFKTKQFQWFLFWLINPITIFVSFMMGQFDIVPVFFLLLAFYFLSKQKNIYLTALALGLGAAFKHYPFLLMIPFVVLVTRSLRDKFIFIFLVTIPYVLIMIPEFNKDFLRMLSFSENQKMLQSGLNIGGIYISIYIVLYAILTLLVLFEKQKNFNNLIKYCLLFTIIYFFTASWFSQRILFLLPPLFLFAGKNKKIFRLIPFLSLMFYIYTLVMYPGLFDHTLLRPIFPAVKIFTYNTIIINILKGFISWGMICFFIYIATAALTKVNEEECHISNKDIITNAFPLILYFLFLSYMLIYV